MDEMIIRNIIEIIVAVLVLLISRYVIPYVRQKLGNAKFEELKKWAEIFVSAAEKTILGEGDEVNEARRNQVMAQIAEQANKLGIKVTADQVRAILESALAELKNAGVIKRNG